MWPQPLPAVQPTGLKLVAAPTGEPLEPSDVREWIHQDSTADDARIARLISGVRGFLERRWNRRFLTQTVDQTWDSFPTLPWHPLTLRLGPVQSVTSVSYTDTSGNAQTWSTWKADLNREPARIVPVFGQTWPLAVTQPVVGVTARYVVGYGDAATSVPADALQAMLLLIAHWYEHPEAVLVTQRGTMAASREMEWALADLDAEYRLGFPLLA
jgi:uncharacterized phiE125 gp8 family phage protein